MVGGAEMLERRIPDVVSTDDLPAPLAAEIDFLAGRTARWVQSPAPGVGVHARALVQAGRRSEAREMLVALRRPDVSRRDVVAGAWAVSRLGDAETAVALLARLRDEREEFLDGEVPLGPTALPVGLLEASIGRLPDALRHLRRAVEVGDARAPLWGALARLELARVLRCADNVPMGGTDVASGQGVERAARTFLAAGGYRALLARLDDTEVPIDELHPDRGVLRAGPKWTVGFGLEADATVRPGKGLVALAHLVAHPARPVTAAELAAVVDGGDPRAARAAAADAVLDRFESMAGRRRPAWSEVLDDATRSRVTKLLRRAIERLADEHTLFARHLAASIETGHVCRYVPAHPRIRWVH